MFAMSIDGVLRQPSGAPIGAGNVLYRALTEVTNVALIADSQTEEQAKHWLLVNDMTAHNYLVLPRETDPEDGGAQRVLQLTRLAEHGPVDLLVEADPTKAEAVIREGIPVALTVHPSYARPEHLPGRKLVPTPWDALIGEVNRQRHIKANDARLNHEAI